MSGSAEALVELDGVRKEYGDVTAVDGIDFTIRRGEFFSLVGPSGCGKTTTLRMISGFERPTAGTVQLNGADAADVPPNERDTNLVFQHLSLFPHMTVGENVEYGLKKSGVDADARTEKSKEYLSLVDLDGYYERKPNELSGGQQQRVALARALVNEPNVLLFDEPLSSLDRKLRKQMQVELRQIHEQVDGSFFYVTHDQEVAMTLSDRMAVLNEGRVEQVGPPEEIYREPASPFVADFIGDTNLVNGTVNDGTVRVGGDDGFAVDDGADADGDVTVSIRPEDIDVVETDWDFAGEVVDRYFQGDQTQYVVEPAGEGLGELTVVMQGRQTPVEQGETGHFRVQSDAAVVFDE
ncbi:ABC transporter ATP-binding protein [Halocalculus aciditolerans]|uniref:Molybdate/tungstate import ATP-binding protein WtpC n=1 Tax=Halocalculus aciditolerans TaxID=1383812 RepID=A0A830EZL6_9EURY|nr:ABC transporter ATP-binding protein [Halocalculus aciditolerans]GGL48049.1 Fe3+/spermidine/putrescine ABC transporter ATP-binding protein [Halocalculus aciditolerans]